MHLTFPCTNNEVQQLFNTQRHTVENLIRLGKVTPRIMLGRRAWMPEDILKAAKLLDKDTPELRNQLQHAVPAEVTLPSA